MTFLAKFLYPLIGAIGIEVINSAQAFAQEYSCGAYGAGAFGEGVCGEVADTGLNVWLIRAAALAMIALAIAIVWWARQKRK